MNKGGGEIVSEVGGSKTVFGEGFYGMFSPRLGFSPPFFLLICGDCWSTVRAEVIAELILERAGPVTFKTYTGSNRFRTDSTNLSCKRSKA